MREMVQQQPGAGVPTSFGVFPSSSFLKVSAEPGGTAAPRGAAWGSRGGRTPPAHRRRSAPQAQREKQHGLTRFGRVSIPCAPGHGREQRVLLTPELLLQLQRHFVA